MRRDQLFARSLCLQSVPAGAIIARGFISLGPVNPLHGISKDPDSCSSGQQGHDDTVLIDTGILVFIADDHWIASGQRASHHWLMSQESGDLGRHEFKAFPAILPSPRGQVARKA
ncbi:hypothetical protein D3C71_1630080 [compost metagenome]